MRASGKTIGFLIAALVVVAVGFGPRLMHLATGGGSEDVTPAIGGPFTLVGPNGATVTDKDFRGRYTLIYFGYTFCPDVCPTSLSSVSSALEIMPPRLVEKVTPIFISVDPERDTPEMLAGYVENFHPAFVGLTGTPEQVADAARAFRVYYAKVEQEDGPYLMDHSSIVYFMGPDGEFLAHFTHNTPPERMAEVMREKM